MKKHTKEEVYNVLKNYEDLYDSVVEIFQTLHRTEWLEEVDTLSLSIDGNSIEFTYDNGIQWHTGSIPVKYLSMEKDEYVKDYWDKLEKEVKKDTY